VNQVGFVPSFVHQPEVAEAGLHFKGGSKATLIGGKPTDTLFNFFLLVKPVSMKMDVQLENCEARELKLLYCVGAPTRAYLVFAGGI
jgi:hypothetical protein